MKARPILFNTDMVKAILSGQKTQTRRALKDQPPEWAEHAEILHGGDSWAFWRSDSFSKSVGEWPENMMGVECPFGQPGDLLYVRETFAILDGNTVDDGAPVYLASDPCDADRWTPSIHMPRWASRLTLEISDVRVERLQEISEEDARAEGVMQVHGKLDAECNGYSPRELFSMLWDSIYSNWHANPWVWCVEFNVHHCSVDALLRDREVDK